MRDLEQKFEAGGNEFRMREREIIPFFACCFFKKNPLTRWVKFRIFWMLRRVDRVGTGNGTAQGPSPTMILLIWFCRGNPLWLPVNG